MHEQKEDWGPIRAEVDQSPQKELSPLSVPVGPLLEDWVWLIKKNIYDNPRILTHNQVPQWTLSQRHYVVLKKKFKLRI